MKVWILREELILRKYLIFIILFLTLTYPGFSQKYTLKFATVAPEGSTYLKVLREYTEEVRILTNGEIKFKIYPSQIQGDEKDVLRKIRLGQLHGGGFTGMGLGEILPETRIIELPLMYRDYKEIDYITSKLFDEFSRKFEDNGFIILGWADVGFAYVYSQQPITSLDDLRGTKMWMWEGDPLAEATFKALGVSAIPISLTDVMTALQTNMIEAVYVPPLPCVTLQWYTRINYITDLPLAYVSGAIIISKIMYDKIPAAYQEILREKGRESMKKLVQLGRKDNEDSIELMKKDGIKLVSVPKENLAELYAAGEEARRILVGKLYDQELLDRVESMLVEFRKKNP